MAGAKGKYSEDVADKIVRTISTGVPKKYAAMYAGISESTLYAWERGEQGIPKAAVPQFQQSIMQAEAAGVVSRLARITQAGQNGDVKADQWYLEHVHSDAFAATTKNEHTGKDGGAIRVEVVYADRTLDPA